MKLYIISGLGADFDVLSKIQFKENIEIVFIDWLIPTQNEDFHDYVLRMAQKIEVSEDFYLLGYSFGGIIVQEIHKIKPSKKIVILASIKSDAEKSPLINVGKFTKINQFLPLKFYSEKTTNSYAFFRKIVDPKNPKILDYFKVRDPYYLKWSMQKITEWQFEPLPEVIQILGDKDIVFPIKKCFPNFVIKNGTHLFPVIKYKEVSAILAGIFI